MRTAIYPGRFDPVTNGHLDIIIRGANLFDRLIVAPNQSSNPSFMFSTDERVALLRASIDHITNVEVIPFRGLMVDFARREGATAVVRGLRGGTDFSYEFDMALMNKKMAPEIESVYLMTNLEHLYISASRIREVAALRVEEIVDLVPPAVASAIRAKFVTV